MQMQKKTSYLRSFLINSLMYACLLGCSCNFWRMSASVGYNSIVTFFVFSLLYFAFALFCASVSAIFCFTPLWHSIISLFLSFVKVSHLFTNFSIVILNHLFCLFFTICSKQIFFRCYYGTMQQPFLVPIYPPIGYIYR